MRHSILVYHEKFMSKHKYKIMERFLIVLSFIKIKNKGL